MPFTVPFKLNENPSENGDSFLLECLKGKLKFSFLSDESKAIIQSLELSDQKDALRLLHKDKELLYLWPLILTDALQELKKHDDREYDSKNINMDTFFDPASLGTTELTDVLTGFSDFEGMLYGASPDHYRDHIAHSFRVWIIGHGVLQSCFSGKLSANNDVEISKNEWAAMWAIIALCHDIGYPLSHIERINEKARTTLKKQGLLHEGNLSFNFSPQMLLFHDTIIKMMASVPVKKDDNNEEKYYTHLQSKYYLKYLKSFDRLDHGIISSLLISRYLVYFLESDYSFDTRKPLDKEDMRQFFIRREILRAIAAHTCQDIYHLTFNNLSILLYLIDEIQCWGRPTLEQSQHEATNIKEGHAEVKEFSEKSIFIKITTEDHKWDVSQQKGVLFQVLKLRKMLRLALERKDHTENRLIFEVVNKGEQKLRIEMKDRGLRLYHSDFEDKAIQAVPKLKDEIRDYSEIESV